MSSQTLMRLQRIQEAFYRRRDEAQLCYHSLLLHRLHVWFPVVIPGGSQAPITPRPHAHYPPAPTHKHTHSQK